MDGILHLNMNDIGINAKRMVISLILGTIAGLICAGGTSILQPITYPIGVPLILFIIYNRVILGLVIGLVDEIKILDHDTVNPILRGAIFGALISTIMIILPELASINFFAVGILFGVLIDLIASKIAQS